MPAAGGLYAEMWSRQAEASAIDKASPGASSPCMLAMAAQGLSHMRMCVRHACGMPAGRLGCIAGLAGTGARPQHQPVSYFTPAAGSQSAWPCGGSAWPHAGLQYQRQCSSSVRKQDRVMQSAGALLPPWASAICIRELLCFSKTSKKELTAFLSAGISSVSASEFRFYYHRPCDTPQHVSVSQVVMRPCNMSQAM